jgi:molecular chaperone GrpE
MNLKPDWEAADTAETQALGADGPEAPDAAETSAEVAAAPRPPAAAADAPAETPPATETPGWGPGDAWALMAEIVASVRDLAGSTERYHARAEQRETVIDHLRAEVDRLRQGERRSLLRPLLVEICRLRHDLLRQAGELPGDFDRERAARLLRSYAESIALALENSGVVTFAPDSGDAFDPRMHRRVGGEPTHDPARAGRIAAVRRDGYLDVDASAPIAPAEVVVFAAVTESHQDGRGEQ